MVQLYYCTKPTQENLHMGRQSYRQKSEGGGLSYED